MTGVVVVDANLLLLLVVGAASRDYIRAHKRLKDDYSADDFDLLTLLVAEFSDIVLLPHIVAETSNFARQIKNPARARIQDALRTLITTTSELPVPSAAGALRDEFHALGVTDAVILHLCEMELGGVRPTLLTSDNDLADAASALGHGVIDYKRAFSPDVR